MTQFEKMIKEDLGRQLGLQVRDPDWSKILYQARSQVSKQISYQVEIEVRLQVEDQVRNNFGDHRNGTL